MTTREFFAALIPAAKPTQRDPDREPPNAPRPDRSFAKVIEHAAPACHTSDASDTSDESDESDGSDAKTNLIPFPLAVAVILPFPQPPVPDLAPREAGAGASRPSAVSPSPILDLGVSAANVVVPFPSAAADPAASGTAAGHTSMTAHTNAGLEEVEIDVPWPMTPQAAQSAPASNIEAIDFRSRPAGEVIEAAFNSGEATSSAAVSETGTPPHLPGAGEEGENSAHPGGVTQNWAGKKARSAGAISAQGSRADHGDRGRIAHGIAAAPDVPEMDSEHDVERRRALLERPPETVDELDAVAANESEREERPHDFSARSLGAMDWQMGRPVGFSDRPAPAALTSAGGPSQTVATIDRLSQLVLRESALIRQHGSEAMSVVLRPDVETELYVHFSQQNGQLCATVRCERGDFQHLNQLWPQLQESMAHQKIALAPLQESSSSNLPGHAPFGAGLDSFHRRQDPSDAERRPWAPEEASTEPERDPSVAQAEEQGGSDRNRRGTRPAPSDRPSWETWA